MKGLVRRDLLDDGGPPEEGRRFEIQIELLEGRERLGALGLLDRKPPERRRQGEGIDAHLRDGHLAMERRGELCGEDGLQDRGNDEEPDKREKDKKGPDADQDARAVAYDELPKATHVAPPVLGAYTAWSPGGGTGVSLVRYPWSPGILTPRSLAAAMASGYPASAWRMMPVPGSVVSTRRRRASVSTVPSATTTMPAWIE